MENFSFPMFHQSQSGMKSQFRLFSSNSSSSNSSSSPSGLSHISSSNSPTMVDISHKNVTVRTAIAQSFMWFPAIFQSIFPPVNSNRENSVVSLNEISSPKGPVFATAIIAGTQAVKKTSDLIPFCHPLPVESIKFSIQPCESPVSGGNETNFPSGGLWLRIECAVRVSGKTGVEMESLTGASVAALTIYDMCKAKSHEICIFRTELVSKEGGKSGFVKK